MINTHLRNEHIVTLEKELAKAAPSQEPVAWMRKRDGELFSKYAHEHYKSGSIPLYTHPSDAAAQIEKYRLLALEGTEWQKKYQEQIAKLEAAARMTLDELNKMRFIETVTHDDYGMVDLFDSAHNVYLDEAITALREVLKEES